MFDVLDTMSGGDERIEHILDFWFGTLDQATDYDASKSALWWKGRPEDDATIRERFGGLVEDALAGKLQSWADTPRGTLALIILCDQFTRSLGRGTAEAFSGDAVALQLCLDAIIREFDRQLRLIERTFLYMPLMHAEDRDMAKLSVIAFEALSREIADAAVPGFPDSREHATRHAQIVSRFGRYPHRNKALGRASTAAELEYLAAGAPTFGQ